MQVNNFSGVSSIESYANKIVHILTVKGLCFKSHATGEMS